ncbi:divergent polysaccharide deacetylase family protein [Pseudomonas abyssi]|uniref:divergent polysaccharide deacetylase family protein n=1 Tax=Pseudomonas abyssi TaxID=170540 RepID=UPI001F47E668|nr:divergent polysaccharide deacetylase family protein [Halopseudomonas gallaeciensis]
MRLGVCAGLLRGLAGLLLAALAACSDDSAEQPPAPTAADKPVQQVAPLPLPPEPLVIPPENIPPGVPDAPAEAPPELPGTVPADAVEPPVSEPLPAAPALPRLAIVIDDVGQSLTTGRRVLALPGPVALAILPLLPHSQTLASEAAAAGKPVMLHLPMENMAGLSIGPGGLTTTMPEAEFRSRLQQALNAFSPIQGVNNHMGSRLTADRQRMDWLMQVLAERQLFFVDSRTTAQTQAAFAAEAAQVPHVSRDIFLDNVRSEAEIDHEFRLVLARARKQGSAVLIGHPYPETLAYLERRLPQLEAEGVQLVSVQVLLER